MKKILLGIFVFTLAFSFVSFVPKVHAENIFTRFLSFGSKGEDVKALQEVLKNEGLLGAAATGYYGTATKEAVTQLQAKNNLEPVGVVGPKTLALVATKKSTVTSTTTTTTTTVSTCTVTSPASITVTSPNGGETYQVGQQVTVTWTSCNVPATANINIGISMGSTSIASTAGATPNDGSEVITLPTQANLPTGTYMNYGLNFKVNLFVSGMAVFDASNNLFTINNNGTPICTPTTPASITVTSPNGGEKYATGQQMNITWNSCNVLNNVSIELQHYDNLSMPQNTGFTIVNNINNSGQYVWTIPSLLQTTCETGMCNIPFGDGFKVAVFTNTSPRVFDDSGNFFKINPPTTNSCQITTTLQLGSTGTEVNCLQSKLGLTQTGYFGILAKAAVQTFQFSHNVPTTGLVGALTRVLLNVIQ